jgi:uncharacterized protein (TIGR00369 family)
VLKTIVGLKRAGRFHEIGRLFPYAAVIGLETTENDGELLTVLRHRPSNIGNTLIPAIHGGVVGALLEHAAIMQILWETELERLPKVINVSIDYLRPALAQDTFARGTVVKQGKKIANVRVAAWQKDPARPIAAAHAHFLMG